MRIVGGTYKGRRFDLPKNFKAHPTTDFAKENLFNVLNNFVDWEECSALDLFSGTGSISFELVSRGCKNVDCVEKAPLNYSFIEQVKNKLGIDNLTVFKTDVFRFLSLNKKQYDIIFADPPYNLKTLSDVPDIILNKNFLRQDGVLIMEHSKDYDFSTLPNFKEKRVYGSVNFSLFINEKI